VPATEQAHQPVVAGLTSIPSAPAAQPAQLSRTGHAATGTVREQRGREPVELFHAPLLRQRAAQAQHGPAGPAILAVVLARKVQPSEEAAAVVERLRGGGRSISWQTHGQHTAHSMQRAQHRWHWAPAEARTY